MVAALWSLLVFALIVLGLAVFGAARWNRATERLQARLEAGRHAPEPGRVDFGELDPLPAPVRRYFRAVLTEGAPLVAAATVRHVGTFDMGETSPQWKPFRSRQRVVTRARGFVWSGVVALLPGVPVRVHDAYVGGDGLLHAALLGVVPVVEMAGSDVSEAELTRFFAEAVWYPTALLPSQGVRWDAIDERSARATLTDGAHRLTMLFRFGADGLIESVRADARGRAVAGRVVPTPWEGRWSNHAQRDGMRVPLTGEVAWLLPEGDKPYWRGTIESLRYEFTTQRDEAIAR
jgi:hypothetical protein